MKKAGDLLGIYFDDIQKTQGEQYSNFKNSWVKIAGEKIGHNTKINDVVDGILIIEIDHPGWKQLINLKEKNILRQINKSFPELNVLKIKFYFNNKIKKTAEVNTEIVITEAKDIGSTVTDENFLSLLKKMSKRSEE